MLRSPRSDSSIRAYGFGAGKAGANIGDIVKAVARIADQTNLLPECGH